MKLEESQQVQTAYSKYLSTQVTRCKLLANICGDNIKLIEQYNIRPWNPNLPGGDCTEINCIESIKSRSNGWHRMLSRVVSNARTRESQLQFCSQLTSDWNSTSTLQSRWNSATKYSPQCTSAEIRVAQGLYLAAKITSRHTEAFEQRRCLSAEYNSFHFCSEILVFSTLLLVGLTSNDLNTRCPYTVAAYRAPKSPALATGLDTNLSLCWK